MLHHLPNALCVLRMLLAVPVAILLLRGELGWTLAIFAVAAVTDGLDGFLAKRFHWTSQLGKILDPLADKILLVTAFVTLAILGPVPSWLAATVVARDVAITLGAIAYRYWIGPLDDAKPTAISKLNTLLQVAFVLLIVAGAVFRFSLPIAAMVLATLVVVATVASGIDYVATYIQRALALSRSRQT
jgi:cardiolipin synthase (CMP-forming)